MIITTSNLISYLLAKGLVSSESIVGGDFTVVDVSGRNRNFKVIRRHNAGYFVKQVRCWDTQKIAMLQCEAACYWLAHNDPDFAALRPLIPDFYSYDLERQVLITGLIENGEDLWQHYRRLGKISTDVAGQLGNLLGTYHRETGDGTKDSPHSEIFPRQIPWILSTERRNSHPFKELSPATIQLFDSVDRSSGLCAALDDLREGWRTSALMQGDMKLENCVLSRENFHAKLRVVDWELADIGDPCWDIGSAIQAFLSAQIMSLPAFETPLSFDGLLSNSSLNGLRAAIVCFWLKYIEALRIETGTSSKLLERCISYGAARMIQSAYEYMQFSPQLSRNALHLLEVSSSILEDPRGVARQLFPVTSG